MVCFKRLQTNTIWRSSICTISLGNLLCSFTGLMLMKFLLPNLHISCFKICLLSLILPLHTTVKSLLNTLPTETREAPLLSPAANSSPDLFSQLPQPLYTSQVLEPLMILAALHWTPICWCPSCIWKIKTGHGHTGNNFILAADGHIDCPIIIPFPAYVSFILNMKKKLVLPLLSRWC